MAKKRRNHYIPRFLLNRFASRTEGRKNWIWQISRDARPVEVSTRDAAVGKYFYGASGTGVEEAFVEQEAHFAEVLRELESGAACGPLAQDLRWLLWSMAVRTRALRQQFLGLAETMLDTVPKILGAPEFLEAFDSKLQTASAEGLFGLARERLSPVQAAGLKILLAVPLARSLLTRRLSGILRGLDLRGIADSLHSETRTGQVLPRAVEQGQIKGLSSLLRSKSVPEWLAPAEFVVLEVNSTAVLGDASVWALLGDGTVRSPMNSRDQWRQMYLPISGSRVLVALKEERDNVLSITEINTWSAKLAASWVYSPEDNLDVRALAALIGRGSPFFDEQGLDSRLQLQLTELAREARKKMPRHET